MESRSSLSFAIVMRARTAGKPRETVGERTHATERVRDTGVEPTDHAGTQASENCTGFPSVLEDRIQPVGAPESEQTGSVAAAHA